MEIRRVHVIVNPASGKPFPVLHTVNAAFGACGIEWSVGVTLQPGDALRFAQEAVDQRVDAVVVYGGDGTLSEVATGLIGSDVPVLALPGGTANVIANELQIPPDLGEACALLQDGGYVRRRLDVGKVGRFCFLLRVGVGLDAQVIEQADREMKDRLGGLAYLYSLMQRLSDPEVARYRVRVDGRQWEADGIACMVINATQVGVAKTPWTADVRIDDGLLDVILVRDGFRGALKLAASVAGIQALRVRDAWIEGHDDPPLLYGQGREIQIEAVPVQPVQCDGDAFDETPVSIQILPGALEVLVPKT